MSNFKIIRTAVEITISFAVATIATKALFKKPED